MKTLPAGGNVHDANYSVSRETMEELKREGLRLANAGESGQYHIVSEEKGRRPRKVWVTEEE